MMNSLHLTSTDLVADTSPGWWPLVSTRIVVNLNSIDISRPFADAISALKSVSYLTRGLRVATRRKV